MALYEITPTNMQGSGFFFKGRAGENMLRGKLVYKHANGAWFLADADLAAETPALGLTMGRANAGQIVRILKEGYIGRSDWTWTVGDEIYTSATPGELTQVAAGLVQVVGMATRPDMISFDPEGSVGAGGVVCALLEGHTAYVGFDVCKGTNYTNYFTVDGTADDVQINAALAYITGLGGGGSLYIERGTYDITANLDLIDDLVFDFQDAFLVLGFEGNMIDLNDKSDIKIIGGDLNGVKATYNADTWSGIVGEGTRVTIKGINAHDFEGKGVFVKLHYSSLEDIWSHDNDQDGIYLTGTIGPDDPTNDVSVMNCLCYSNGRKGFNSDFLKKVNYTNCKAYSNTEDGWNIEGGPNAGTDYFFEDVKLEGCFAYSNSQYGFRLQLAGRRTTLVDCDAYDNTFHGLFIRGQDTDWTLHDTQIIGGSYYENTQAGITFAFGIKYLKILGVSAFNNDQGSTNNDGITFSNVSAAMENVLIDNVYAYDNQGAPTQDRGVDLSTTDVTDQNIRVIKISGTGNTSELFRSGPGVIVPEFFVPVSDADGFIGNHAAAVMPDTADTAIYAQISLPTWFQELVTARVVVVAGVAGDLRWSVNTDFGRVCAAEDYNTHNDAIAANQDTLLINDLSCIDISAALTSITLDDLVGVQFNRLATNVLDTISDSVYFLGIKVGYV